MMAPETGPFAFQGSALQFCPCLQYKHPNNYIIYIKYNFRLAKKMPTIEIVGLCLPLKPQKEKFPFSHYFTPK
jgi:hypothetical protein